MKYKVDGAIPTAFTTTNCSRLWAGISKVWFNVRDGIQWFVRDGCTIGFWYDSWLDDCDPLIQYFSGEGQPRPFQVKDFVGEDGEWDIIALRSLLPEECFQHVVAVYPHSPGLREDFVGWKGGKTG
ncbi:hypothetical protein V6N13_108228 [Hibiscus sabdariffa]